MRHIFLIIILVVFDQITKYFFGYLQNTGSAFGIFKEYSLLLTLFSIIALIVFSYLFFKFLKYRLMIIFALAGIIGNLIDRLFLGYVRDFIDIKIIPVFNFADAYLNIGLILFIVYEIGLWKRIKTRLNIK